jgi:hypothetical protein
MLNTPTKIGIMLKKVGGKMLADKKMIEEMEQFDDSFPDGVYAVPRSPGMPKVKVRALWDYCQEKGVEPKDLSQEEMEKFLDY